LNYCIILSTTNSEAEAEKIANILLENRAASCVQLTPIVSLYHWENKIERANEISLLIKTTEDLYPRAESLIKENHSYKVPQIVKIPISTGLPEYLNWILEETGM
jgi:periplasmic divalent cation tolerance protein